MGSIVKTHLARKLNIDPGRVSHISLMPCFDKKLEASRDDFLNQENGVKDVDCVITTLELDDMLARENTNLSDVVNTNLDTIVGNGNTFVTANSGSASGGYSDHLCR